MSHTRSDPFTNNMWRHALVERMSSVKGRQACRRRVDNAAMLRQRGRGPDGGVPALSRLQCEIIGAPAAGRQRGYAAATLSGVPHRAGFSVK